MVESYNKLKVPELKEELKKRDLPVTGKKAELVARLTEHDAAHSKDETNDPVHEEQPGAGRLDAGGWQRRGEPAALPRRAWRGSNSSTRVEGASASSTSVASSTRASRKLALPRRRVVRAGGHFLVRAGTRSKHA